ncbi:MAG: endonuclease [Verrucomicrobiaceae bacterium]|nr:endonuclease [Verrucomicrobiaceae bacterium]MDB6119548.1 endonuclease [Verrucomicrobiaceae bacterium]
MSSFLHKNIVLVLNKCWQAIDTKTPAQAFCMMAGDSATALDIGEDATMTPTRWEDWLQLPVRERDNAIGTARGEIRVPTVLVLARFDRVPRRRPRFSARNVWARDGGVCQYTGRKLKPSEGNIDHVVPRSRGGSTTWENCVLAHREVNTRKADRTPQEAGLRLIRQPATPRELPTTIGLHNAHGVQDWEMFLV